MLFSEPKIPQLNDNVLYIRASRNVSVLFSEPKIPQCHDTATWSADGLRAFQCSSASRKFLNRTAFVQICQGSQFQCSSASRKFLNAIFRDVLHEYRFQCSSASRKFLNSWTTSRMRLSCSVSVLFSEPKIPQWIGLSAHYSARLRFQCSSASRKIPQSDHHGHIARVPPRFSALQRAENSSIGLVWTGSRTSSAVSVLFSEPKIPQFINLLQDNSANVDGFSALQRAENSSILCRVPIERAIVRFSALQRAENSSIERARV